MVTSSRDDTKEGYVEVRFSPRSLGPHVVVALLAMVIGATVVRSQVLQPPSVPVGSPGDSANPLAVAAVPSPTPTPRVIVIPEAPAPAEPLPSPTPAPTQVAASLPTASPAQEPAASATQPPASQLLIADVPTVQPPTAIPSPIAKTPPPAAATEPPATPSPVAARTTPTPTDSVRLDFTADQWAGGFYRGDGRAYGRPWTAVYGAYSAYPRAALSFAFDTAPVEPATLIVTGLDDEWPALNEIVLEVNGQPVYSGAAPFANWDGLGDGTDAAWTTVQVTIPTGVLQAGANEIAFANLTRSGNFNMPPYILLSDATLQFGSLEAPQPVSPVAETQSDRDRQQNTVNQEKKQKDKGPKKDKKRKDRKGKPGRKN